MKTGIIKHHRDSFFFTLHEDYQTLCRYEQNGKVKTNDCAAVILSLFENIAEAGIKRRAKNPLTFPASNNYIRKCLLNHYSEKTVSHAVDFLQSEGFISVTQKRVSEKEYAANEITFYPDRINEILEMYEQIRGAENSPTVILPHPYRKITPPLPVILPGEYSIQNSVLESNHSLIAPENFNPDITQIPANEKPELKEEKPAGITKNGINENEINYGAFVELCRVLVKWSDSDRLNQYLSNMRILENPKKMEILESEFQRYAARRFSDVSGFPYLDTDEKVQAWARKRVGFADFNTWTLSTLTATNVQSFIKQQEKAQKAAPAAKKEQVKSYGNALDLILKSKKQ